MCYKFYKKRIGKRKLTVNFDFELYIGCGGDGVCLDGDISGSRFSIWGISNMPRSSAILSMIMVTMLLL